MCWVIMNDMILAAAVVAVAAASAAAPAAVVLIEIWMQAVAVAGRRLPAGAELSR